MPVGIGFDVHRLAGGRRLVLGGVAIDHPRGPVGHSDGDPVLHALIDALLGASGGGDIGERFPDTDEAYRGISSDVLVKRVMDELAPSWSVVNADVTVVAEEPKLGPHRAAIRSKLAELLRVAPAQVNVKGKTAEGLGAVGSREAIAAFAAVELKKK